VGWANSSIRHPAELPVISPDTKLRGVIREEPLEAALHPHHAATYLRQSQSATQESDAAAADDQQQPRADIAAGSEAAAAGADNAQAQPHVTTAATHAPAKEVAYAPSNPMSQNGKCY